MSKHGYYWTREEEISLLEKFNKDIPITEIAKFLQRSKTAIYARLEKLGINLDDRNGCFWTKEEDLQLKKEISCNTDIEKISRIHKRSRRAIFLRLAKIETDSKNYGNRITILEDKINKLEEIVKQNYIMIS